jgi:drug/metabolite transporter (DMT)-like permease
LAEAHSRRHTGGVRQRVRRWLEYQGGQLSITAGTLYQSATAAVWIFGLAAQSSTPRPGSCSSPAPWRAKAPTFARRANSLSHCSGCARSSRAVSLLYFLIQHGAATRVSSLFYLTPPVTALMAYVLVGETLNASALAGMALAAVAVAMVVRAA